MAEIRISLKDVLANPELTDAVLFQEFMQIIASHVDLENNDYTEGIATFRKDILDLVQFHETHNPKHIIIYILTHPRMTHPVKMVLVATLNQMVKDGSFPQTKEHKDAEAKITEKYRQVGIIKENPPPGQPGQSGPSSS